MVQFTLMREALYANLHDGVDPADAAAGQSMVSSQDKVLNGRLRTTDCERPTAGAERPPPR